MLKVFLITVCLLVLSNHSESQTRYPIIPYPNKLVEAEGEFEFKGMLSVIFDGAFKSEMETMGKIFEEEYFTRLGPSKNGNLVVKKNSSMGREAYKLTITKDKILIESNSGTGCFYAFQTIRQLMKLTGSGSYQIATCTIEDSPAYPWRSYMLDEGRKFQGKEVVKKLLDQMALIKMNVFQWHLTEDPGWRIEIKKYPMLTQIGAWRDSSKYFTQRYDSLKGKWDWSELLSDPNPTGGFYTQEDIKEIVAYAAKRHITIVPEIEMPGHAIAAIAAYPWLCYGKEQVKVFTEMIGITKYAFNVADPKVNQFLEDVLSEVMALFPGKIIHIGGDEVKYDTWKDNPDIKKLMDKESLTSYSDVQVYFTNQISNFLKQKGFRMMGWNEILGNVHLDGGVQKVNSQLAPETIVQFWKGDSTMLKEALANGYDVVYSRSIHTYLDLPRITLVDAYNLSPVPRNITRQQTSHFIGIGCQMWGECTPRIVDVYQNTFPRIAAYAEVGWTNEQNKDFDRFTDALVKLKKYWDKNGIYYLEE
jgi:hexosaminidase